MSAAYADVYVCVRVSDWAGYLRHKEIHISQFMYQFFITNLCVCWENMENDAMKKVIEYTYSVQAQWYTHTLM